MRGLKDSVAVITGAASGLGAATARRFAQEGAKLVLGDIQAERGEAIARELGATFVRCDVTREADIEALVTAAKERHGRLDCMINNAGVVGAVGTIRQTALDDFSATLAILLSSVFLGMKHAGRIMCEQRSGCILSTSSIAGILSNASHGYVAAKHGVIGLTRSCAAEFSSFGVRVNAVAPGTVPTRMTAEVNGDMEKARETSRTRSPLGRTIEPDDIAAAFAYLASDDARNITGQVLAVDGGVTAFPLSSGLTARPVGFLKGEGG